MLPVARYKNGSLSKFFVCWYAFSTICSIHECQRGDSPNKRVHLVVALLESLLRQPFRAICTVVRLCRLHCHVQIPTFNGEFEPHAGVLYKMQHPLRRLKECLSGSDTLTHLREIFLLEISNDALSQKRRSPDDVEHLFVVISDQCKFESVFRWIKGDGAGAGRAVETMHSLAFHTCEVDGVVKGANNTMVAVIGLISSGNT